jgi:uncharacterized membrane protein
MSLKTFHLIFVTAAVILAFGFGGWLMRASKTDSSVTEEVCGIVSVAVGVGLVIYEVYFLKKTKDVGFL